MLQILPSATLAHDFRTISPEEAGRMLLSDGRQRPANDARVAQLEDDMRGGAWRVNGEAIVFDADGALLDGRKRLLASVRSGASFRTLVVRGVTPSAYLSLDSRKTRRLADVLTIEGHERGRTVETTLRFVATMAEGGWKPRSGAPTHEMRAMLEQHPSISDSLERAFGAGRVGPPTLHGAIHFVLSRIDRGEADRFFEGLYDPDGQDLSARDPRRALARRLQAISEMRERVAHRDMAAMFVTAWNLHVAGGTTARIPDPEDEFPAISLWEEGMAVRVSHAPQRLASMRSGTSGIQVSVRHVDPDLAEQWLEANTSNRRVSRPTVQRYARDMASSAWMLNGETVKFGRTGRLLDGQHRLRAVVESGDTVAMLVVEGLDERVFDTLDGGERRKFADVLAERGVRSYTAVSAALKVVLCIENDRPLGSYLPTNAELEDAFHRHPGIVDGTSEANLRPMEPGHATALSYLFGRSRPAQAAEFFRRMRGIGIVDDKDAVLHLRNRLENKRGNNLLGADTPSTRLSLSIVAWNAFVKGKPVAKLALRPLKGRAYPAIA